MNILLYTWNAYGQEDLEETLKKLGHQVKKLYYIMHNFDVEPEFSAQLEKELDEQQYDLVFSFNYFQVIARVCGQRKVKYVSWIYDSPVFNVFSDTIKSPWNYLFVFDQEFAAVVKTLGAPHVYAVPLAANCERLCKYRMVDENYINEVSFVGNLYQETNHYDKIPNLPSYLKGYFESLMQSQKLIFGCDLLNQAFTKEIEEQVKQYISFDDESHFREIFLSLFLETKLTSMERIEYLQMLADKHDVTLYSKEENQNLAKVKIKGSVDYMTEMPKVFYNSKINLNMTLRSIHSGLPLRIWDVLGSGGFLLTNYQPELFDYFEPGKDMVYYESKQDLEDKVAFYLDHDEERKAIAEHGFYTMKENYSYDKIVPVILQKVMEE